MMLELLGSNFYSIVMYELKCKSTKKNPGIPNIKILPVIEGVTFKYMIKQNLMSSALYALCLCLMLSFMLYCV